MATKITDAFKSHPVHIPAHKTLDFDSFNELPDTYEWVQPDSIPSPTDQSPESFPLIDLSLPNAPALVGDAFRSWGAFQAINHGVPVSLLHSFESTVDALFSLSPSDKNKAARPPDGVDGYGLVRISSFFPKRMWSEGFTILNSPLHHFQKLWPDDYAKHCEVYGEYDREMRSLCARLIWVGLGELGVTRDDVEFAGPDKDFKTNPAATQLNSYPVCPDPERAMGLGVHTDTSLLTIVYQNNTSGLQFLRKENQWVTVEPVDGALVVQVGDLLQIMTNGMYKSPLHQAFVNRTRQRLSMAYIFGTPETVEISPLKKLLGPTQPPIYRTVTWTEYLGKKAEHFNNALKSVRIYAPFTTGLLPNMSNCSTAIDANDQSQVKVG